MRVVGATENLDGISGNNVSNTYIYFRYCHRYIVLHARNEFVGRVRLACIGRCKELFYNALGV